MIKLIFVLFLATFLFVTCNNSTSTTTNNYFATNNKDSVNTGGIKMIEINTPSGKHKVWTKRFGNNPTKKVLLLHGGPGCTHEVFECFESYLPQEGIEFIYYDQLGSYRSEKPTDTSLWRVGRFVEEVEQVRVSLGLNKDNFYLLGHSWGGILAMEYALKYQQQMKGLIISNMMSSCPAYDKYNEDVLQKKMDKKIVDSILNFETTNTTTHPRYMQLKAATLFEHSDNLKV